MNNRETLWVYQFNNYVISVNLEGITHQESLISPQGGGNCLNWVLGHILVSRDDARGIVGLQRLSDEKMDSLYKRGTVKLDSNSAYPLEDLRGRMKAGQKELEDAIRSTDLSAKPDDLKELTTLAFHEAYHSGQTGLLRRIAGKDGAIK